MVKWNNQNTCALKPYILFPYFLFLQLMLSCFNFLTWKTGMLIYLIVMQNKNKWSIYKCARHMVYIQEMFIMVIIKTWGTERNGQFCKSLFLKMNWTINWSETIFLPNEKVGREKKDTNFKIPVTLQYINTSYIKMMKLWVI